MTRKVPQWVSGSIRGAETFGNIVRGAVFAAVGVTFIVAAVGNNPHKAEGLNGTLKALASSYSGGRYILLLACIGFFAFSAASMTEAWLRDVDQNVTKRN